MFQAVEPCYLAEPQQLGGGILGEREEVPGVLEVGFLVLSALLKPQARVLPDRL